MKKSIDFPSVLTVPQSDAEDILLAETLESMEIEVGHWSQNDGETASRDARELAGEAATPKDFIAIRARLVLARLKNYVPDQERIRKVSFNTTPLVLGLLFLAYLGGALTDRFATVGHESTCFLHLSCFCSSGISLFTSDSFSINADCFRRNGLYFPLSKHCPRVFPT